MALGIAASQPVGLREQFGTMTKPFHPGGAARAGLMSALLASQGFTASPRALEAPRGLMQVVSTKNDWSEITDELGQRFEISFNTYKPFACGIVIHPSIDACVQLRAQGVGPSRWSASSSRCIRWCWSSPARRNPPTACRASSASTTAAPPA
jgi:2-methylcitrate dehydratase PrpD